MAISKRGWKIEQLKKKRFDDCKSSVTFMIQHKWHCYFTALCTREPINGTRAPIGRGLNADQSVASISSINSKQMF